MDALISFSHLSRHDFISSTYLNVMGPSEGQVVQLKVPSDNLKECRHRDPCMDNVRNIYILDAQSWFMQSNEYNLGSIYSQTMYRLSILVLKYLGSYHYLRGGGPSIHD